MRSHFPRLFFFFLMLFVLEACVYEPHEDYYFKKIPQLEPVASISLKSYSETDTIRIYSVTNFKYDLKIANGNIKKVQVMLDGQAIVDAGASLTGSFLLGEYFMKSGTYELKIQFISSSGTGSLLDKLDGERVQVWRKWVLIIDVDPPPTPLISYSTENGFLKLTWIPFNKANFVNYRITLERSSKTASFTITDPKRNFWIDSTHIGSSTRYTVTTKTFYRSAKSERQLSNPQELTLAPLKDSTIIVTWRKSKYASAFKEYQLLENYSIPTKVIAVNDTTLALKLKLICLGLDGIITLEVYPKYGDYGPLKLTQSIANPLRDGKLGAGQTFFFNATVNSLIGISNNSVNFYNSEMAVSRKIPLISTRAIIPFSGRYAVSDENTTITTIDLLTEERKFSTQSTASYKSSWQFTSNEFTGAGSTTAYDPIFGQKYIYSIYDLKNKISIWNQQQPVSSYSVPKLSDDGKYMAVKNNMYKLVGSSYELIGATPQNGTFINFRPDNTGEFIQVKTDKIYLMDSENLSVIKTITIPSAQFVYVSYDPGSKNILYRKNDNTYEHLLVNIDTEEIKKFKVVGTPSLTNGILFFTDGSYKKMN